MEIKQWRCIICEKFVKYKLRVAHKYCSNDCAIKGRIKICSNIKCKKSFISKTNQKICPDCQSIRKTIYYRIQLKQKICINCGELFNGRAKQTLCEKCYNENRKITMVHKYSTISRSIICKDCGKEYAVEEVKLSFKTLPYKIYWRCNECKNKFNNINLFNKTNRMIGKNNPNYKDGRSFVYIHDLIRIRIYRKWTYKIFERDNFCCTICNDNKKLNAHHIIPLNELITNVLKKYKIINCKSLDKIELEKIITEIAEIHKLDMGITLCENCHKFIHKKDKMNAN